MKIVVDTISSALRHDHSILIQKAHKKTAKTEEKQHLRVKRTIGENEAEEE